MAKQPEDLKTADLLAEVAPVPKRRGRPPKSDKPMTTAERKRASRLNSNSVAVDIERPILERITQLYPDKPLNDALAALLVDHRELLQLKK